MITAMIDLGTITGIIGAVTGVAGLLLAWKVHVRTKDLKALDLRSELRRCIDAVNLVAADLPGLIDKANSLQEAVATMAGAFNSGMMKRWAAQVAEDRSAIEELASHIPDRGTDLTGQTPTGLETKLVDLEHIKGQLEQFVQKYEASVRQNEAERQRMLAERKSAR